jgi:hypothetical protein
VRPAVTDNIFSATLGETGNVLSLCRDKLFRPVGGYYQGTDQRSSEEDCPYAPESDRSAFAVGVRSRPKDITRADVGSATAENRPVSRLLFARLDQQPQGSSSGLRSTGGARGPTTGKSENSHARSRARFSLAVRWLSVDSSTRTIMLPFPVSAFRKRRSVDQEAVRPGPSGQDIDRRPSSSDEDSDEFEPEPVAWNYDVFRAPILIGPGVPFDRLPPLSVKMQRSVAAFATAFILRYRRTSERYIALVRSGAEFNLSLATWQVYSQVQAWFSRGSMSLPLPEGCLGAGSVLRQFSLWVQEYDQRHAGARPDTCTTSAFHDREHPFLLLALACTGTMYLLDDTSRVSRPALFTLRPCAAYSEVGSVYLQNIRVRGRYQLLCAQRKEIVMLYDTLYPKDARLPLAQTFGDDRSASLPRWEA